MPVNVSIAKPRTYGVKLTRGPFVKLPEHPLACNEPAELSRVVKSLRKPLAADLFCGAGGLSLGLQAAGFEVVLGVDHDDDALATHRAFHPGLSVNWDLFDEARVDQVASLVTDCGITLLCGGPPCQPFSRAGRSMMRELVRTGRRTAHDHRRDLWESFVSIAETARPAAVLMENVPDMALDRRMLILRAIVERFESIGYSVEERVVVTADYGVPQMRQRLILVALRDGLEFCWPAPAEERPSLWAAIGDLPEVVGGWRPGNGTGLDPVATGFQDYPGARTRFQERMRAGLEPVDKDRVYDHITRPVREDDALAFAQMTHETKYSDLDESLKRYRDDIFDDKYKRLNPDIASRTITAHIAKDGYWYIHPYQDRTLTVREAARIQTFPDRVRFSGPPSAAFRQIGNAVPPMVGEALGRAVLDALVRRQPARFSTQDVALRLATWFQELAQLVVPWLQAQNRWVVVQTLLLGDRMSPRDLWRLWQVTSMLSTPETATANEAKLRMLMRAMGREERVDLLLQTASWFAQNPDAASSDAPVDELRRAPNVSEVFADLACRVIPGDTDEPVLVSAGVLRVAARFHGDVSDKQNKHSDGRLSVARMIGGNVDTSPLAHLALIELASAVCTTQAPACSACPLSDWCASAGKQHEQLTFASASPAE